MITEKQKEYIVRTHRCLLYQKMGSGRLELFLECGGIFVEDDVHDDEEFMVRYTVERGNILCRKREYEHYFRLYAELNMGKYLGGELPRSFKDGGMARSVNFLAEEDKVFFQTPKEQCESTDFSAVDFLQIFSTNTDHELLYKCPLTDVPHMNNVEPHPLLSKYFASIKRERVDIISLYRNFLLKNTKLGSKLHLFSYDNVSDFVRTFEKQFGYYYEVIMSLKDNGYNDLFFPNDGLGICSIIATILGLRYRSYETYAYGYLAVKLGIITSSEELVREDHEVLVACNLSTYIDVKQNFRLEKYVVIDENRLWSGCNLDQMFMTSRGRMFSDLQIFDEFITFGGPIATCGHMISTMKNVPLSSKAEAFLICSDLPVYTDGVVKTITPAIDGGEHYIDVTDYVKDSGEKKYHYLNQNIIETTNDEVKRQKNFFSIITLNHPRSWDRGRVGQSKIYEDANFTLDTVNEVVTSYGKKTFVAKRYDDPRQLISFRRLGAVYVANKKLLKNPHAVQYCIDGGKRIELMYMHEIQKGKVVSVVYRDKNLYQNVKPVIGEY